MLFFHAVINPLNKLSRTGKPKNILPNISWPVLDSVKNVFSVLLFIRPDQKHLYNPSFSSNLLSAMAYTSLRDFRLFLYKALQYSELIKGQDVPHTQNNHNNYSEKGKFSPVSAYTKLKNKEASTVLRLLCLIKLRSSDQCQSLDVLSCYTP